MAVRQVRHRLETEEIGVIRRIEYEMAEDRLSLDLEADVAFRPLDDRLAVPALIGIVQPSRRDGIVPFEIKAVRQRPGLIGQVARSLGPEAIGLRDQPRARGFREEGMVPEAHRQRHA
ncbi:hypothetical protein D9M72_639790 [compost metagenome]